MDGYGVIIENIRACGRETVAAGEDTRKVELSAAVAGIEPAMAGGSSAGTARELSATWETRVRRLGDGVVQLGTDLGDAAEEYARDEETARRNLETIDPRYRRYE